MHTVDLNCNFSVLFVGLIQIVPPASAASPFLKMFSGGQGCQGCEVQRRMHQGVSSDSSLRLKGGIDTQVQLKELMKV